MDPDSCGKLPAPPADPKILASRTSGCTGSQGLVQYTRNGAVISQAIQTSFVLSQLNTKSRLVLNTVKVGVVLTDNIGEPLPEVRWTQSVSCSASTGCSILIGSTSTNLPLNLFHIASFDFTSPGNQISAFRPFASAEFGIGAATNLTHVDQGNTYWIQCDSESGQVAVGGCVHDEFVPTYVLHKADYPDVWAGDRDAINVAHKPTTLHRLIDGKDPSGRTRQQNHDITCAGFVPNGILDSCDEYPYASTLEGGNGTPGGGHTWHVPLTQNSLHGSQDLGLFYTDNRLFNGEKFNVVLDPAS
jgi:hypothetical protein